MDKAMILLKINQCGNIATVSVFRWENGNPSADLAYIGKTAERDPQIIAIEALARYEQILNDPMFPSVWPEIRINGFTFPEVDDLLT